VTLTFSILLGTITGKLMVTLFDEPKEYYTDDEYWAGVEYEKEEELNEISNNNLET
jgi:hypothetical protein